MRVEDEVGESGNVNVDQACWEKLGIYRRAD
jgi:hypothetical protein